MTFTEGIDSEGRREPEQWIVMNINSSEQVGEDVGAISDGGAQINVFTIDTADKLEAEGLVTLRKPLEGSNIRFGKRGNEEPIITTIEPTGLIDEIVVVSNVESKLIHNKNFNEKGAEVVYKKRTVEFERDEKVLDTGMTRRETLV